MDSLPKNSFFEYNEDTLKTLRKQYNFEKKEEMNAAVDGLEEWLKKQAHFTKKEYSREYLERLIILNKGSVERAKMNMDKLCTLRTLLPQFFEHYDVRADCASHISDIFIQTILPKMTREHHRVYLAKMNTTAKLTASVIMKMYIMIVIFCEYLKSYDYCDGLVAVVDLRNINIVDVVKELNLVELRQLVTISMEGCSLRVKGIHMLTTSATIDMLTKIMKQIVSAKIGNRIFVHRHVESLCEIVPKHILPVEYGGTEKTLKEIYEKYLDVLSTKEFMGHMKVMNEACSNENHRLNDSIREQYLGIAGSFRTLSVD